MTVTVKNNMDLIVPASVRRRAGIKNGDQVEFKVHGGMINIIPKLPSADDEYTPEQRRATDARLAVARKGPYYGPFETAEDAGKFLRTEVRKRKAAQPKTAKVRAIEALKDAPQNVRRAFYKQLRFLLENLQHPSLHAKKYDESMDLWQARVNSHWRGEIS